MNKNSIAKIIATSLGLGYLPKAPGTFGALLGVFIVWLVSIAFDYTPTIYVLIALSVITYILGYWSSNELKSEWGDDPSKVVMDETCGMIITMIAIQANWLNLIVGFILFRFFDILKPFGIKRVDEQNTKHSVMLDDVLSGIYANVCLQLLIMYELIPVS
jgi:phosphatidylglycerophosphatase A